MKELCRIFGRWFLSFLIHVACSVYCTCVTTMAPHSTPNFCTKQPWSWIWLVAQFSCLRFSCVLLMVTQLRFWCTRVSTSQHKRISCGSVPRKGWPTDTRRNIFLSMATHFYAILVVRNIIQPTTTDGCNRTYSVECKNENGNFHISRSYGWQWTRTWAVDV